MDLNSVLTQMKGGAGMPQNQTDSKDQAILSALTHVHDIIGSLIQMMAVDDASNAPQPPVVAPPAQPPVQGQ